jgi:type VI secretion system protein ImpH
LALERLKHNDSALSDFIELFEHRLISLFYKAWAKYQLPLSAEHAGLGDTDKITQLIKNFAGTSVTDSLPLFYAGHFARANRSQMQLEHMLAEIIQADVKIKPLVGQWRGIEQEDRCQIGKYGRNHRLGPGVLLGKRFWDIQSNVDINIGNLSFQAFNSLAEGSEKFAAVEQLIYQYLPSHISVNLKLVVQSGQTQRPKLGRGFQLARNGWLGNRPTSALTATRRLTR